jgi:hypothetical protein
MLIAGGLFAGGAATFAWSRVPIWRRMPVQKFIGDFEETLRRTDKVQPALLVAAIVSAAGFALTSDGSARVLALVGAAGFVVTLAASIADPRAAPEAHRRDAARGGESDLRDARPLVSRASRPLDVRDGVVRGGRRGSDLVISR